MVKQHAINQSILLARGGGEHLHRLQAGGPLPHRRLRPDQVHRQHLPAHRATGTYFVLTR